VTSSQVHLMAVSSNSGVTREMLDYSVLPLIDEDLVSAPAY